MFDIGDKVLSDKYEGVFVVKAIVQKDDNGEILMNIENVGDEDESYLVSMNELFSFTDSSVLEEVRTATRKEAMTRYVAILPDLRELAFFYYIEDDTYEVYILERGYSVLDDNWLDHSKQVKCGKSTWEDAWDVYLMIAEKYGADVSGAKIPELLKVVEDRRQMEKKVAYSDFQKGDRVAFVVGNVQIEGNIVDGWSGRNQSYIVKDDLGILHECFGNWLVAVNG